jgi:hypothetical protein
MHARSLCMLSEQLILNGCTYCVRHARRLALTFHVSTWNERPRGLKLHVGGGGLLYRNWTCFKHPIPQCTNRAPVQRPCFVSRI